MSTAGGERFTPDEAAFYKIGIYAEFEKILHRELGEERTHSLLDDGTAFHLIMMVIWNGLSHAEAVEDVCDPQELADRHKEWAKSGVLAIFLFHYRDFHIQLSSGTSEQ